MYGRDIGRKFHEDGSVRRYPGNTVISDVGPGCSAYDVMVHLRQMVLEAGFDSHLILLPENSYHMTVIQGVNDQVRDDAHWPADLPKDLPMTGVDDYMAAAIGRVENPGPIRMKFRAVQAGAGAFIVQLDPADPEQGAILREYRDQVAGSVGLRLPGHESYVHHISLGYIRIVPEGEDAQRFRAMINEMNRYIANRPVFTVTPPRMGFYDHMLHFDPQRIPRD